MSDDDDDDDVDGMGGDDCMNYTPRAALGRGLNVGL